VEDIMRVIRTDFYLDKELDLSLLYYPGLSFAWFKNNENRVKSEEAPFYLFEDADILDVDDLQAQISKAAEGLPARIFAGPVSPYGGMDDQDEGALWKVAISEPLVIEESPLTTIGLSRLIAKSPGVAIGTYLGFRLAGDYSAMMMITVPTGIMIVGAAISVSRALDTGLSKAVDWYFKGKLTEKRSIPPTKSKG
jgi:hypothetical protein